MQIVLSANEPVKCVGATSFHAPNRTIKIGDVGRELIFVGKLADAAPALPGCVSPLSDYRRSFWLLSLLCQ